jgi:hypothetical protein
MSDDAKPSAAALPMSSDSPAARPDDAATEVKDAEVAPNADNEVTDTPVASEAKGICWA